MISIYFMPIEKIKDWLRKGFIHYEGDKMYLTYHGDIAKIEVQGMQ